jgi:hypothetical protein
MLSASLTVSVTVKLRSYDAGLSRKSNTTIIMTLITISFNCNDGTLSRAYISSALVALLLHTYFLRTRGSCLHLEISPS